MFFTDGTGERSGRMAMSDIMTIIIAFHTSHHRGFKHVYTGYLACLFKLAFPNLLSYTRSLEVMHNAVISLCRYFSFLKSEVTGREFIDSTSIKG